MKNWYYILLIFALFSCQKKSDKHEMHAFPYEEISIDEVQELYKSGKLSVVELTQQYLDRIDAIDDHGPSLNAVIQVNPEALEIAKKLDAELKEGKIRGPLHGIPVLLKDNIDTQDQMYTTAGSRALMHSKPLKDSWVAAKLREAGAVILGKANLSEWANFRGNLSSSGWSGIGGQTKNPYFIDRTPCGSSSGSGVAVSANLCVIAIGTETNGSIVCPSSINGVVGIKPTVGLISRSGVIPISFTQDTPGPMARTVADAAIALGTMVGVDKEDSKTLASEGKYYQDYTQFLNADGLMGKRLGLFHEFKGTHYKVDELMQKTIDFLKKQGVTIVELDQISEENVDDASFDVMLYEYKDGLNKYFASLGPDAPIKSLDDLIAFNENDSIELKYFDQFYLKLANKKGSLDDEDYKKNLAFMLKEMGPKGIDRVMDKYKLDAIIAPTDSPAWKIDLVNGDAGMLGSSSPAAITGYPSITVPMGDIAGLPVGISFFGKAWSEGQLIEIAYAFEQLTQKRIVPEFKK